MFSIDSLTADGRAIALETIAFRALTAACQKAASEIAREAKLEREYPGGIDAYNDDQAERAADEAHDEVLGGMGIEVGATFLDYCRIADAADDAIKQLRDSGTFARSQSLDYVATRLTKQKPQRVQAEHIEAFKAMVKAHSGGDISDEDAKRMAEGEAIAKAAFFNERYASMLDNIKARVTAGIEAALAQDRQGRGPTDCDLDVLVSNLPANVRYVLLGSIDFAMNLKCDELATGMRYGQPSPVAKIPVVVRAGMVAILRGDQAKVRAARQQLAHADREPVTA